MVSSVSLPNGKMLIKLDSCAEGGLSEGNSTGFALLRKANLSLQKENEWLKNELKGQIESVAIHKDIFENENKILKLKNRLLEIKYASELNKHQLELEKLRNSFNVSKLQVLAAPPPPVKPAPPDRIFPTIPVGANSWGGDTSQNAGKVSKSWLSTQEGKVSETTTEVGRLVNQSNTASTSLHDGGLNSFVSTRLLMQSPNVTLLPPCRPPTKAESSAETRTGPSTESTSSPIETGPESRPKTTSSPKGKAERSDKWRRKLAAQRRPVKTDEQSLSGNVPSSPQVKCEVEEKIRKAEVFVKSRVSKNYQGVKTEEESKILASLALSFDEHGIVRKRKPCIGKASKSKNRKMQSRPSRDEKTKKKPKKARKDNLCAGSRKGYLEETSSKARKKKNEELTLSNLQQNDTNKLAASLRTIVTQNSFSANASTAQSTERQRDKAVEETDNKQSSSTEPADSKTVAIPKGLPPPNEVFPKPTFMTGGLLNQQPPATFCLSGGPLKPPTADTIKPSPGPGQPYATLAKTQQHVEVQKAPAPPLLSNAVSVVPKTGARPIIPGAAPSAVLPSVRKRKRKQPLAPKKKPFYHTAIRPKRVIKSNTQIC